MIKKIILQLSYTFVYYLPALFRELFLWVNNKDKIIVSTFLDFRFGYFHKGNWGDDLNYYFLAQSSGKNLIVYQNSLLSKFKKKEHFMCIGSMIHDITPQTTIWGSGVLIDDKDHEIKSAPKKILAVRGPLTRQYFLDRNIKCPAVYGDPALLLPLFYRTEQPKKYKIGIIPHIYDLDSPLIQNLCKQKDVIVIQLKEYSNWLTVVDLICQCEFIISSSLHGIIVSDAYHIPNCWIELSDKVIGKGFKFRDYYLSVGKNITKPVLVKDGVTVDELLSYKPLWTKPKIDLQPLIATCPFTLPKLPYA